MKYGASFVAHIGRYNNEKYAFYRAMKNVQLTHLSRIECTFDPFSGKQAESLRLFAFHVDTPKLRQTNFKCSFKLNVVCDRTEPHINLTYNDGEKVLLKTSNLEPIEIAEEVKVLDEIHQKRLDEFNAAKRKKR